MRVKTALGRYILKLVKQMELRAHKRTQSFLKLVTQSFLRNVRTESSTKP